MAAEQSDGIHERQAGLPLGWNRLRWRHRRVMAREAAFLDGVVDAQLEFLRTLPMHQRDELAGALAVLVMLAQDHRHCGQGWISRRALRHRVEFALGGLDVLLQIHSTTAMLPQVD
jgi:hypothetical protein